MAHLLLQGRVLRDTRNPPHWSHSQGDFRRCQSQQLVCKPTCGLYFNYHVNRSDKFMSVLMENKVVLVTGSSSGIGEATVLEFAKLKCKVVVHGTNKERVDKVCQRCNVLSGHQNLQVVADLRSETEIRSLIDEVIKEFGRLDILVNNAGLFTPVDANDGLKAYDIYKDMIKVNLDSVVMLTLLSIDHLKRSKGSIVNISSNLHKVCLNGGFAYSTAKAGLEMFTKSIAVDLAPHVRVNSISPGPVATSMPSRNGQDTETFKKLVGDSCLVGRVGEPSEIARMVIFLSSPESAFITGSDFIIDGGSTIKPAGKVMGKD